MRKITLGLDIGQYSIKGVRPLRGLGIASIDAFLKRVQRDQGSDSFSLLSEAQQSALKELVSEGKIKHSDSVAVSLPGHLISTREITLPFTDSQRIKKTLYYEAENQLPFDLEEAVIDYQILPSGPSSTRLLIFAAPITLLKKYLEGLASVGIDPVHVSVDQIALYHYFSWSAAQKTFKKSSKEKNGEENLIMDLGATKTVLCGIKEGKFDWARSTPMGADFFIELLKEEFGFSWKEAEDYFMNLDQPGGLQEKAIPVLTGGLAPWLTDMNVSLTKVDPDATAMVSLCGGTQARIAKLLSDLLHRKVELQNGANGDSGLSTGPTPGAAGAPATGGVFAQAIGLTLLPVDAINFRREGFAHPEEKLHRGWWVSTSLIFLLLLGLAGTDFYLHAEKKERQLDLLKKELRADFRTAFPENKNVVDEVKQAEAYIADIRKRSDLFGIGFDSPLLLLKKITDAMPTGIHIYITEYSVEGRKMRIEAQTTSFDSVDQIRSALMKVEPFEGVTVSDAKVSTDDTSRIGFRIQIALKTTPTTMP